MTNARVRIRRTAMAKVSVPIRANIDCALMFIAFDGDRRLLIKSRMAELWPPSSEDMVDEIAGVELVCMI